MNQAPRRTVSLHATQLTEIPADDHFVILRGTSRYIPGDQRSIDCPGHGYPGGTENYLSYVIYPDRESWEAEITALTLKNEKFRAVVVKPATIKTTTTVNID